MTRVEYRKEVWAILKEFRDSKVMTLEEVATRIMATITPKEKKNPYVGLSTREDGIFRLVGVKSKQFKQSMKGD